MAATRVALPVIRPSQEVMRWYCPNCRKPILRRGEQGVRNRAFSCRHDCHRRQREYAKSYRLVRSNVLSPFRPGFAFIFNQATEG